jgi:hypothetical protein
MSATVMEMFVIYERPRDYPDKFVVRRWLIGVVPGVPTADADWFHLADTLDGVRAQVPPHCVRLERDTDDEPQIVEVWI